MNIFYLSNDPADCARQHVDKHVVKMILEYGQLMSTAHRVIDGVYYEGKTDKGRRIARWLLPDEREHTMWKASHIKHPSGIWVRSSKQHYQWLYSLWLELLKEYTYRYNKEHKTSEKKLIFKSTPVNIPDNGWMSDPTPAMPDIYKTTTSIDSYRNYYLGDKKRFARWKNRTAPAWFI